ncbi:hypothetical protein K438DRAFT_1994441 [Mycena galopus ATCC 62051]|nr:hypothetical protein K438DRAFT_1994441 [Mycena galopus ATCC 62051]
MVLTRRASRAENSIIRWLPNEVLAEVMSDLPRPDLLALCRTSRLFCNIATPLLYRTVAFSNGAQLRSFLRTMKPRSRSTSLALYVRRFLIKDENRYETKLPASLVETVTSVLCQIPHLQLLDLIVDEAIIDLPDILFPNLSTFRYVVQTRTSASLSAFLSRHSTITHLTLLRGDELEQLEPINLPNLLNYTGPPSFIRSFSVETVSLTSVFLLWRESGLDELPLLQLSRVASLDTLVIISPSPHLQESVLLGSIAAQLCHLKNILFRRITRAAAHVSRVCACCAI